MASQYLGDDGYIQRQIQYNTVLVPHESGTEGNRKHREHFELVCVSAAAYYSDLAWVSQIRLVVVTFAECLDDQISDRSGVRDYRCRWV